jgi:hypothetical protein
MKPPEALYDLAREYVGIIEALERTDDKDGLDRLEEERGQWHDRFVEKLKKEGIRFKDPDHVTAIAFKIARHEL